MKFLFKVILEFDCWVHLVHNLLHIRIAHYLECIALNNISKRFCITLIRKSAVQLFNSKIYCTYISYIPFIAIFRLFITIITSNILMRTKVLSMFPLLYLHYSYTVNRSYLYSVLYRILDANVMITFVLDFLRRILRVCNDVV